MKREKMGIILLILFVLAGCAREYGIIDPDGTYLNMTLQFPESGNSERSRLIHSQSDELKIKLTYPDGSYYEAEFTRNEESIMTVQVEDLDVASGVVIEVTMGIAAYDLVLTKASRTKDITEGANSVSLTLEAYDLTVSGTLVDGSDQPIPNNTFTVDGANVTTDAGGNFTLAVNTENLDDLKMIRVVNGDTFDFVRTHLALLQDWDDFTLKTAPEIYLDFMVSCDQYPLAGASWSVLEGGVTEVASGTADALGQIVYQQTTGLTGTGEHTVSVSYKGVFVPAETITPGTPGAFISDMTLQPYIIYSDSNPNDMGGPYYDIVRMEDIAGTNEALIDIENYIETNIANSNLIRISNMVVDYVNGRIIVYVNYGVLANYYSALLVYDGWTDSSPDLIDVTDVFTLTGIQSPSSAYSIPQMAVMSNGNVLVAATYGTFQCDVVSGSIVRVWETLSEFGFVSNGVVERSDGTIQVLGVDRSILPSGDTANTVAVWQLLSDGSFSEVASIPAGYDAFPDRQAGLMDVYLYYYNYEYSLGLYEWNSQIVMADFVDSLSTGGEIIILDGSGTTWDVVGTPLSQSPDSDALDYVIPLAVLPNNRFYFVEEVSGGNNFLIEMDTPTSIPGAGDSYEYLLDGSGEVQYYYYYYESSGASL